MTLPFQEERADSFKRKLTSWLNYPRKAQKPAKRGETYHKEGSKPSYFFWGHAGGNHFQGLLLELVHAGKTPHAIQDDIVQRLV